MSIVQSGLSLALSTPLILAAWFALLRRQQATMCRDTPCPPAEPTGADPLDLCLAPAAVDLDALVREAAAAVDPAACSRWVRMQIAVGSGLVVPVDPSVLRLALRDIILGAINAAPGGQVLITAATLGCQLHIGIIDDGPGTDRPAREVSMRRTEALIALQGGSLAVEAQPGRGTAVTIRFPMPVSAEPDAGGSMQIPVLAEEDA